MHKILLSTLMLSFALTSCGEKMGGPNSQGNNSNNNNGSTTEPEDVADSELTLKELVLKYYEPEEFVVGAASNLGDFDNVDEQVLIYLREFGYNTPSNDFKQTQVYRTPGAEWTNQGYMKVIETARKYGQVVRSHGPIAPQSSTWVREDDRTPEELEEMLIHYMTNLSKDLQANHDVVWWMDVVNETFTNSTQKGIGYDASLPSDTFTYNPTDWFGPRQGSGGWENPWPIIGFESATYGGETFDIPCYIPLAFSLATEHAPDVKKIYNDHGKEINPDVQVKLHRTVLYLRSEGYDVDGIGWQGHVKVGWEKNPANIKNLIDAIEWCHANDMEFHVTELDVELEKNTTGLSAEAYIKSMENAQADTMEAIFDIMLRYVGKGAHGINVWTMCDDIKNDPYKTRLYTADNMPKEAYYRIRALISKYGAQRKK